MSKYWPRETFHGSAQVFITWDNYKTWQARYEPFTIIGLSQAYSSLALKKDSWRYYTKVGFLTSLSERCCPKMLSNQQTGRNKLWSQQSLQSYIKKFAKIFLVAEIKQSRLNIHTNTCYELMRSHIHTHHRRGLLGLVCPPCPAKQHIWVWPVLHPG